VGKTNPNWPFTKEEQERILQALYVAARHAAHHQRDYDMFVRKCKENETKS